MNAPESRRHELYNGLTDILGVELADTLMTYLPTTPIQNEILDLKDEVSHLVERFDQLQNVLIAGFLSMIVALLVAVFFG